MTLDDSSWISRTLGAESCLKGSCSRFRIVVYPGKDCFMTQSETFHKAVCAELKAKS